jgi:hypothetical protein
MRRRLALVVLLCAPPAGAAEKGLPLPPAPVRLVIPDVAAFDAALTGAYRRTLTGEAEESDPVVAAWRRSQVGAKLEDQWQRLAGDLPWTWNEIRALGPGPIGLALLDVGHLEAVVVIDSGPGALAAEGLPEGETASRGGVEYHLVARGAADASDDADRRMGLAWARLGTRLALATSERALALTIDESLAGRGFAPPLPGLASLDLDVGALRKDRYFRREFAFGPDSAEGHVLAALRREGPELVEVRQGRGEVGPDGARFEWPRAAAQAWEPGSDDLAGVLRAALLEPLAALLDRPVAALAPLPPVQAAQTDRYLVNLEQAGPSAAVPGEGELAEWHALFATRAVSGWGYALGPDGARRVVFPWPAERDEELARLCLATVSRRAGPATLVPPAADGTREIRVGPGLPAVALRRVGSYVWIGRSAGELADAPTPTPAAGLVRWAVVDLDAVRGEGARWSRAEGPASPEQVRPFSDRILGLLGWMPETTGLRVERRAAPQGWTERVVFVTRRR